MGNSNDLPGFVVFGLLCCLILAAIANIAMGVNAAMTPIWELPSQYWEWAGQQLPTPYSNLNGVIVTIGIPIVSVVILGGIIVLPGLLFRVSRSPFNLETVLDGASSFWRGVGALIAGVMTVVLSIILLATCAFVCWIVGQNITGWLLAK